MSARRLFGALGAIPRLPSPPMAAARVTLGVVNWIGYGPIHCPAASGYYRRYGWNVKLVTFSDSSMMSGALESGELDAATLAYDSCSMCGWPDS